MESEFQPDLDVVSKICEIANLPEVRENSNFYIFDEKIVAKKTAKVCSNMPQNGSLYYSMKANPNKKVLELLSEMSGIKGIEVSSIGELDIALEYFSPSNIIYSGPAKSFSQLKRAIEENVLQIHCESLFECEKVNILARDLKYSKVNILLRVNLKNPLGGAANNATGCPSKFGIDEDQVEEALKKIVSLKYIRLLGFHFFAGSGVLNYKHIVKHFLNIKKVVDNFQKISGKVPIVDVGGGFGIDYSGCAKELDIVSLGKCMNELFILDPRWREKEIILELGRYLVGEAGMYATQIVDIKKSMGKTFLITSGGFNHQKRPAFQGINHPTFIVPTNNSDARGLIAPIENCEVEIVGPLCTKDDILARSLFVKKAKVGDFAVLAMSGAYGLSAAPTGFLSFPKPNEYMIKNL
jgi:diaminopimelate decarboxylase